MTDHKLSDVAASSRRVEATPRKALIDARNDLVKAIVQLRGGHAAVVDDCDKAIAALDIAIGLAPVAALTLPCRETGSIRDE